MKPGVGTVQLCACTFWVVEVIMQKKIIMEKLRKKGYRITRQRMILIDIILEGNCSCCKEIYYEAVKRDDSIGIATVYRMLRALEEIRILNRNNQICASGCDDYGYGQGCSVEFEDGTVLSLPAAKWDKVVRTGLKQCGYEQGEGMRIVNFFCGEVSED